MHTYTFYLMDLECELVIYPNTLQINHCTVMAQICAKLSKELV